LIDLDEVAGFCLDYPNKLNESNLTEKAVILDNELNLCEDCGAFKMIFEYNLYS